MKLKYQMQRKGKGGQWESITAAEFNDRMKRNFAPAVLVEQLKRGAANYIYTASARYRILREE